MNRTTVSALLTDNPDMYAKLLRAAVTVARRHPSSLQPGELVNEAYTKLHGHPVGAAERDLVALMVVGMRHVAMNASRKDRTRSTFLEKLATRVKLAGVLGILFGGAGCVMTQTHATEVVTTTTTQGDSTTQKKEEKTSTSTSLQVSLPIAAR